MSDFSTIRPTQRQRLLSFIALRITAEVMNWVYSTGLEKPRQAPVIEQAKPEARFSSSKQTTPPPPPQPVISEAKYLEIGQSSVQLTIFTADVDAKPSEKLKGELYRSTKKSPPSTLKYELIYVCHPPSHATYLGC